MTKRELSELDRVGRVKAAELAGIDPGLLQTIKLKQALASNNVLFDADLLPPSSSPPVPSSPPLSSKRSTLRDTQPTASSSVVQSPRVSREDRLKAASPRKNYQSYGWDGPTPPQRSFGQDAQTVGSRRSTPLQHGRSFSGIDLSQPFNSPPLSPVVIPTGHLHSGVRSFSYGGPDAPVRLSSPAPLSPKPDVVRSLSAPRRDDVFTRLSGRSVTRAAISELTAALYNMNIKK